jgi:outer membrane assembly lipoprotein YfiO
MKRCFLLTLSVFFLASCMGQYELLLRSSDADLKYKKAIEYFDAKKYSKALDLFENVALINRGTQRDDSVQYYMGMSQYYLNDYMTAESTFEMFAQVFQRSPFTEKVSFLRVDCLYQLTYRWELDQLPSHKAIAVAREFLYYYPTSDYTEFCNTMIEDLQGRLERKSVEAAKLYYKMEDYRAATYALRGVLKDNPDTRHREEVMYYIVAADYKYAQNSLPFRQRERYLLVIDAYYNFISEFPESKYVNELEGYFKRAQRATNRTVEEAATPASASDTQE